MGINHAEGWAKGFYNIDRKEELGDSNEEAIRETNFEIKYNLESILKVITYLLDIQEDELIEEITYLLRKDKKRDKYVKQIGKRVMGKSKDRQKLGISVMSLLTNEIATPDSINFDPNYQEYIPGEENEFEEVDVSDTDEYVLSALDFLLKKIGTYIQ